MDYNNLNEDTKTIIDTMVENLKCTKERAIEVLVEFGMISMVASVSSRPGDKVQRIIMTVAQSAELTEAAKVYRAVWMID